MKKIIFILLLTFLFPEKFIYSAGFKFITVGEATISSSINDDNDLIINTLIASNKFLDKLYRVRDNIKLVVNPEDFSLKKIEKDILEGTWEKHYTTEIDSNLNVITENSVMENDKILYDPIAIIYSLRNKELIIGKKFEYDILGINEIKGLITEVIGTQTVKVPAGKYKCIKVVPYSSTNEKIFKENGYMTAWFTNDDKKIPVKIELKTNIGNLVLKLKKIIP